MGEGSALNTGNSIEALEWCTDETLQDSGKTTKNSEYPGQVGTQRKPWFKKIPAPQCSLQHYAQWPGHGSNLDAH